ncbi:hypothetical protein AUW26_27790 [Streptomyces sp. CC71]|nr:hypothetical protein AUW26_27790 [Streptomyces sp. CC71]
MLDDPEPARGRDLLTENFPPQLRAAGPRLISQYEAGIQGLRGGPGGDSGRPVTSAGPRSS